MNEVLKQYLVTALWSSVDDDGTPLDSNYDIEDVNSDSIGQSEADLNEFIDQASKFEGFSKCDLTDVAHDFWLTRNGSNNYYAMLAVDTHGSACRDNSLTELISIGKGIEEENNNE
jgi:hypothetical protein